jgi:hypothetical protein
MSSTCYMLSLSTSNAQSICTAMRPRSITIEYFMIGKLCILFIISYGSLASKLFETDSLLHLLPSYCRECCLLWPSTISYAPCSSCSHDLYLLCLSMSLDLWRSSVAWVTHRPHSRRLHRCPPHPPRHPVRHHPCAHPLSPRRPCLSSGYFQSPAATLRSSLLVSSLVLHDVLGWVKMRARLYLRLCSLFWNQVKQKISSLSKVSLLSSFMALRSRSGKSYGW